MSERISAERIQAISSDLEAIKHVEQRKSMLERIAGIVNALQRLTSSLETLLYTSGSNKGVAEKAFGLLDYLDDKQKQLTTGKIEIRLEAIDDKIRDELSHILSDIHNSKETNFAAASNTEGEEVQDPLEVVSEFRRKVRLSMAYRLLLTERGAEVHSICLDVAPELISNCIKKLQKEEKQHTGKLLNDIRRFNTEIKEIAQKECITPDLKKALVSVSKQLAGSVSFIKEHTPVDTLPEIFDMEAFLQAANPEEKLDVQQEDDFAEELGEKLGSEQSQGFFKTLNNWINSPMDVSWKDAKKKKI